MTVKELYELLRDFKQDFNQFKKNEFHNLENKVDRNTRLLAIGVGVFLALEIVLKFVKI